MTLTPIAVPFTTYAGEVDLPVHAALLAGLGFTDPIVVTTPPAVPDRLAVLAQGLRRAVAGADVPVLAAECSFAGPALSALRERHPSLNLVWADAHADLNTPETSGSGLLVGMALAAALGRCLPELLGDQPAERTALLATQTLDPAEAAVLADGPLFAAETMTEVLERLPEGPVHVHLDGDVLDPYAVSGGSYPEPGGPSPEALAAAFAELAAQREIAGVSACVYPEPGGSPSPAYRDVLAPLLAAAA